MFSRSKPLFRLNSIKNHIIFNEIASKSFSSKIQILRSFNGGVWMIPHMEKRKKGGEDAYTMWDTMIAVADGVGGWADSGVDPALYSRQLCRNIRDTYNKSLEENRPEMLESVLNKPIELLVQAAEQTREQGSSTAVIWMLDTQKDYLHTANLGDSGYILLRQNGLDLQTLFRTKEQTHGFNFPFQVGVGGDDPSKANYEIHEVQDNDILVVGSDGLFDNLFDEQITEVIKPFIKSSSTILDPELVAQMIAKQAETLSLDTKWMSPFAKSAYKHYYDFKGGKHDDVTVVVAQIKLHSV